MRRREPVMFSVKTEIDIIKTRHYFVSLKLHIHFSWDVHLSCPLALSIGDDDCLKLRNLLRRGKLVLPFSTSDETLIKSAKIHGHR